MPVSPSYINTARISRNSPAHYVSAQLFSSVAANGNLGYIAYPNSGSARLVDVIVYQHSAGTGGTSFTVDVKNAAGTSLLTTLPVITLASGADKFTDAKGELSLPSGWTRQVLKTDATVTVSKGAKLVVSTIETGTYSPHPIVVVVLVFEPLQ